MDGLNPTLAFAALFFGLSGAHDATQDPPPQPVLQALIDCPALMLTAQPIPSSDPDTWTKVLEESVADLDLAPAPIAMSTMAKAPEADPCDPAE